MNPAAERCAILFPRDRRPGPEDEQGCLLPRAHYGPHEFIAESGQRIAWETDMECDCEDCRSDEPDDWCIVYGAMGIELTTSPRDQETE